MNDIPSLPTRPPASIGKLIFGVILAILGVLFTLDNFGLLEIRHVERLWPVLLIAIGVASRPERADAPLRWRGSSSSPRRSSSSSGTTGSSTSPSES